MAALASLQDLQARWRPLSVVEQERASALLGDASALVRGAVPGLDSRLEADPPTFDADLVKLVVCGIVKRAMVVGPDAEGVASSQQGAGPFQVTQTFGNPMGEVYLSKSDRRKLGLTRQRAFSIDLAPEDAGAEYPAEDEA